MKKFIANFICSMIPVAKWRRKFRSHMLGLKAKIPNSLSSINKKELDNKIKAFKSVGVNVEPKRKPRIIVSLTSFPARMYDIHYCLYSLLNQSLKPDMVILWIGSDQFPNKEKDLPDSVLNLIKNGLTIKWCEDIKSYKKLIPALSEFPNDIIVTADDDNYYPDYWLKTLYDAYMNNKTMIHCMRAHKVGFDKLGNILPYNFWEHQIQKVQPSFNNFFTGIGGVLYPPHSLHKDVTKQELFLRFAPNADDIWFWSMAIKNGTKINVIDSIFKTICINPERELGITGELTLAQLNVRQGGNDSQLAAVLKEFNLLPMISFNSGEYWEERYVKNGNSGAGSYGRLAHFKADVLNKFVSDNKINSVIEFGVGDGNNLSLFKFNKYLGIDVSKTILSSVSKMFYGDNTKSFIHTTEFNNQRADLSVSLDVIYHLLENEVFNKYMNNLFVAADRFVIIYASNKDEPQAQHVRHRKFTDWIEKNKPDWKLQEIIHNKYLFDVKDPDNTSFADFYIFKK